MTEVGATQHGLAGALSSGLPGLVLQFLICLALLAVGVLIQGAITPFRERELLRDGNPAAAVLLAGEILGLALPIASLLATTSSYVDILVWGVVAIVIQLGTVTGLLHLLRGTAGRIEAGQVAAAVPIMAGQLAVGLLNAAAMVPV